MQSNIIEDLKNYRNWKEKTMFQVIDKHNFYTQTLDKFTDDELLTLNRLITRNAKICNNYDIYIIDDYKDYIFISDNELKEIIQMPYTTLNKDDLYKLLKTDVISNVRGKINFEKRLIKIEDSVYNITPIILNRSIVLRKNQNNGKYIARSFIFDNSNKFKCIRCIGITPEDAVHKLREKIEGNILLDSKDKSYEKFEY